MSKHILSFVAVALLVAAAGCGSKATPPPPPERPPAAVSIVPVVTRDAPIFLDEIGKCVAPEVVSIQPQVAGRVTEIFFKDGAEIKKGDPLFTIDPRPFQAQLDQAKADLALNQASLEQTDATLKQYQAQLEQAQSQVEQMQSQQELNKTEFERAKNLLETGATPKQDFDRKSMANTVGEAQVKNAVAAVAVAQAQIRGAIASASMVNAHIASSKAAIETAQLNLDYASIKSPIDGRAGQRLVDVGNVVQTMNAPTLVVIQRLDPIYADFTIPETELARVRKSMADHQLKVEVRAPGDENARIGDLSFLDTSVQDLTGTVKLRATLTNADRYFWPGQFVRVKLILGSIKDALLVPAVATQISQTGPFVYVVQADNTADLRPVKIGQRYGDLVLIESGVAKSDQVVVTGQMMLYPHAKVAVQKDTPPATAVEKPGEKTVEKATETGVTASNPEVKHGDEAKQ